MILVFGKTGQVATELALLEPDARFVSRDEVNLTQPVRLAAFLNTVQPTAIINAAAYTAVDQAEAQSHLAMVINGASVGVMAEHAAGQGIPFVHISTDYVFDGSGSDPRRPEDRAGPLGIYGQSKLGGEVLVRDAGGPHVILRTSWVFSAHGNNFLKTMLRLSETRDHLTVVADQIGGPTPARDIARTCLMLAEALKTEPEKGGTYHYAGAPDASWADFARAIFDVAGRKVTVEDIPTSAYPTPAARPLNSRLDCTDLQQAFGIKRPDWRAATEDIVRQLT